MSELDRAVQARIAGHQPERVPPFAELRDRRRRRRVRGAGVAVAVLAAVGVAVAVAVPLAVTGGPRSGAVPAAGPTTAPATAPATLAPSPTRPSWPAPPAGKQGPSDADRAAYARWQRSGSADYTMRLTVQCFCPPPRAVLVTVRGGTVVSPAQQVGGRRALSIEDLFAIVFTGKADRFTVAYDPATGFPSRLAADYIENAIDDEQTYLVTDYRPTPR